jgi:Flp pilus assembly protein TadG
MTPLRRLRSLFRSETGNVLVIGAAALPLLMGAAGLAIDTVQLAFWKRQMQRAADSAALAGAHALVQDASTDTAVANDLDEHIDLDLRQNETPVLTGRVVQPGTFANGTLSTQTCAARAVSPCYSQAVQVSLTSQRWLPFMGLFTATPSTIEAAATAAIVQSGEYCLIALYDGTDAGVIAKGNPSLDLGCGIATNSRATSALDINGAARIRATPIAAVGGIQGGSWYVGDTTLQPYSSKIKDPFASIANPSAPTGCSESSVLQITGGTAENPILIDPSLPQYSGRCWGSWDIQGYAKLAPGNWYVNNGMLDIKGSLTGDNVTLIMTGDNSSWTQNGGGKLSLTAPTSGEYKGIVIFRDRTAGNVVGKEIKINGGADLTLVGSIYGASTNFWIGGNAELDSECIQLVGWKLEFKGGGAIRNVCEGTGSTAFRSNVVRLVG